LPLQVGFQLISVSNTLRQQEVCGGSYLITSFPGKIMTLGFLSGKEKNFKGEVMVCLQENILTTKINNIMTS